MLLGKVIRFSGGYLENRVLMVKVIIESRGVIEVIKAPLSALEFMGWYPGEVVHVKSPLRQQ
jgi:hypothetical protein